MYRSVYDYAVRRKLYPEKNRKGKTIAAYIVIDDNGNYERIEAIDKKIRKRVSCPDISKGNSTASPICEKKKYIIYSEKANVGNGIKYDSWKKIMHDGAGKVNLLYAVCVFIDAMENDDTLFSRVNDELSQAGIKEDDFISFRVGTRDIEKDPSWGNWFENYVDVNYPADSDDSNKIISELTGEKVTPVVGAFPQNNAKIAGTGVPIYSNNHKASSNATCAFKSYGVIDSSSCPMSIEEANTIKAGLEYLLDSENNCNRNFEIIYWYDLDDAKDIITRSLTMSRRAVAVPEEKAAATRDLAYSEVLNEVFKGVKQEQLRDSGNYHIIRYSVPAKGRFYMTEEHTGTYRDLYDGLQKWYKDSSLEYDQQVEKAFIRGKYTLNSIYSILKGLLTHKDSKDVVGEIRNEYGENRNRLLYAMYNCRQIPEGFYRRALQEVTNTIIEGGRPPKMPLQVIKLYLIREGNDDMNNSLNEDSRNIAYNCGRWFAAIDMLQYQSSGGKVNASIARKYYKAAKRLPAQILTTVTDNKENYLAKLDRINKGKRIMFERLFDDLAQKIGTSFPAKFSIAEQGAFDLGYAQQKQDFFKTHDKDGQGITVDESAADSSEDVE
ncbi:MAG: type I-C CRISPR-associated protein Cas8c/Csd1 [Lachnospiraceae bacterium]